MIKKVICFLIVIGLFFNCSTPTDKIYHKNGLKFIVPAGWEISEEDSYYENEGFYLSIEKNGFTSSGLVTISWVEGVMDLDYWLNAYKEDLSSNKIYKNANLSFDTIKDSNYGVNSSRMISYSLSLMGVSFTGEIHAFHNGDYSFAVLQQGAVEDKSKNNSGFEKIKRNFEVINHKEITTDELESETN